MYKRQGQDIARLRDEISGELREVRTELVANVHSAIQTTAQLQAEAQKQASDCLLYTSRCV